MNVDAALAYLIVFIIIPFTIVIACNANTYGAA